MYNSKNIVNNQNTRKNISLKRLKRNVNIYVCYPTGENLQTLINYSSALLLLQCCGRNSH